MIKLKYKYSLFLYFFVIFSLFTVGIIIIEQQQEKKYKEVALKEKLDIIVEMVNSYLQSNHILPEDKQELKKLSKILPKDIRLTVIDNEGNILFEKNREDYTTIENHLDRPEIRQALLQTYGTDLRTSVTVNSKFLYYAKYYTDYYVRVALPYNINTVNILKANNAFIYITLIFFSLVLLLIDFASGRFAKSITQLRKIITDIKEDKPLLQNINFKQDELGEINKELIDIVNQKEAGKQQLKAEKEKLMQHFQYSGEGLARFTKDFKKIHANALFIQYLNFIIDRTTTSIEAIFKEKEFHEIHSFFEKRTKFQNIFSSRISKYDKIFLVSVVVFEDESFELTIKDISKIEKNTSLKREITSNIAHELRTPLASIRGYLETLHEKQLSHEKQHQFIERAYKQALRLSEIVEDISLISKIEETESSFKMEVINISHILNAIRIDIAEKLSEKQISLNIDIDEKLTIKANYSLIYSVFRNLIDNSINYAGNGIDIFIKNYMKDNNYVYFSYCDTGVGVPEHHLSKLFERFYRIDEGRQRGIGGSGLGLSIVKNAIKLHKGDIQVKNGSKGGLEFLFSLGL